MGGALRAFSDVQAWFGGSALFNSDPLSKVLHRATAAGSVAAPARRRMSQECFTRCRRSQASRRRQA